jgi:RNA polymerase sigma-70 factor (ECF subfamily)
VNVSARHREEQADQALIRLLFERHGDALLAYATGLTGSRSAAEEIVQETILRAWRHAGELPLGAGARRWLMTVARDLAIDRARAARPAEATGDDHMEPVLANHADLVAAVDAREALRSLPAEYREVLVELHYKGRTVSEAAEALGIPVGTVKSRAYHALRNLRGHLDRQPVQAAAALAEAHPGAGTAASRSSRPVSRPFRPRPSRAWPVPGQPAGAAAR